MDTPRRYPRTLQEAFGPHTSRHVHVEAPRASLRAWAVYLAAVAIALACAALAGCNKQPLEMPFTGITKTQPDEHGVVCYRDMGEHEHAISCVKVR